MEERERESDKGGGEEINGWEWLWQGREDAKLREGVVRLGEATMNSP